MLCANYFPPTIVVRHRKENLNKCSLRGLENRSDFLFFRYPLQAPPPYEHYILLTLEAPEELCRSDHNNGLLVLDATWRYAKMMEKHLPESGSLKMRRLPHNLTTAYPRRQNDCSDPSCGLASIEAIVCAYALMGRSIEGLLNHYHWKDSFLEKNNSFLLNCTHEREALRVSSI
jgi:pre-rRNA-processing protein TSR3